MFYSNIMEYAIEIAKKSHESEVPVGAVIAIGNDIISYSTNKVETDNIEWHHAEFVAIEKAINKLNKKYLNNASIYVTLEPCILCAALLDRIRIKEIYFGSYSPKQSSLTKCLHLFDYISGNTVIIGGLYDDRCFPLIKDFFYNLRNCCHN